MAPLCINFTQVPVETTQVAVRYTLAVYKQIGHHNAKAQLQNWIKAITSAQGNTYWCMCVISKLLCFTKKKI